MIRALSNWDAHTSATEGEGRCEKFKDCPFMGKMPGLVKISLGGASGGNDNKYGPDKDENNEFYDEDSDNDRRIDGVADLDGVNDNENDGKYEANIVPDEDELDSDVEDEVENESCKYCCFF